VAQILLLNTWLLQVAAVVARMFRVVVVRAVI
jgi:hypothetical protein